MKGPKKRKKRSPIAILKDKCWSKMSLWSRLKHADEAGYVRCITCSTVKHYKEMFAGHYKHGVLDYYPMNINPQCFKCNNIESGMRDEYYLWLVKTYGQKKVDDLRQRASMAMKGEPYTIEQLEAIYTNLENKLSGLQNLGI